MMIGMMKDVPALEVQVANPDDCNKYSKQVLISTVGNDFHIGMGDLRVEIISASIQDGKQ